MNLGEAKTKAIKLIDEYSNKGALITPVKNADYLNRMNQFSDMAQREIATYKLINAEYDVTQSIVNNLLGDQMRLYNHFDLDLSFMCTGGKSYYFEVNNLAEIYIEEQNGSTWTELVHISNTTKNKFTVYKGLITPSSNSSTLRLRFSGQYIYDFKNIAIYYYTFPTAADVPDYNPVRRYTMPDDYYRLNKIVTEYDYKQYVESQVFKWEGKNTFVIPYDYQGSIKVLYYRYPTKIEDSTTDDYEFEIDLEVQELIPLYIAQAVLKVENPTISSMIFAEYQNKLANIDINENSGQSEMQNVWNW